jgi:hypothetical protein
MQLVVSEQFVVRKRFSEIGAARKRSTLQVGRVLASLMTLNIIIFTGNTNWWPAAVILAICLMAAAWFTSRRPA